jgi:hypothetical protein
VLGRNYSEEALRQSASTLDTSVHTQQAVGSVNVSGVLLLVVKYIDVRF